ncbi:cytochrome P450 [Microbacterium sp. A204]|uniref:cytochrome P450 n=1 Tax=Microbacterium sp. A204 TaxID=3457321 RepID=UPI003FCEF8D0
MSTPAVPADIPVFDGDPFSMEALADPIGFDGRVRELGPVVYIPKYDYYAVTQWDEIQKSLRDWRKISSDDRPFYEPNPYRPKVLVLEDPPSHTKNKAAAMAVLSGENLVKFEQYFAVEAERIVSDILANGPAEIDAFHDLSARYVLKVFPDMLGLPEEGRELLLKFGDGVFNVFGPDTEFQRMKLAGAAPAQDWVERNSYRDAQTEGTVGWQLYELADAGKLPEEDARQVLKSIFAAGFDTTTASIASMIRALADHPDEWAKLKANPDLVDNAWEESIRYYPASRFGGRYAKHEVQIGENTLPEGAKMLMMWLGSGRDHRKYDNPDTYLVDRDLTGGHLSFGFGIHTCAGNLVARLEARTLLKELVKQVDTIELTGEPRQAMNYQAFGHEYVPVRLTPKAA